MLVEEIMTKNPVSVSPETEIHELADLFVKRGISGAPVVDASGEFLGVVLEEGLIFHDKKVHLPSFVHIAMGFLTLGVKRFEDEVNKITAVRVSQIMERDCLSLSSKMTIEEAATNMIEKSFYYCPVVDNKKIVGIVTKKDIVRAIAEEAK
jgi:CBS domain-containing protein